MANITAHVHNYLGIAEAHLDFSKGPCLVGAPNRSGKTSLAQALQAVLTGAPIVVQPFGHLKVHEKSATMLVRDGESHALAQIVRNEGEENDNMALSQVNWPKCLFETAGGLAPVFATAQAAGIPGYHFLDMSLKDRHAYLVGLLEVNKVDKKTFLKKAKEMAPNVPAETLETVWGLVEAHGAEAVSTRAAEKATEGKGSFREVTGTTYGKDKALSWRPDGWDKLWDGYGVNYKPFDDAIVVQEGLIAKAQGVLARTVAAAASEADVALAGGLEEARKALSTAKANKTKNENTKKDMDGKRAELEGKLNALTYACAHCGKPNLIVKAETGLALQKFEGRPQTAEQMQVVQEEYDAFMRDLRALNERLPLLDRAVTQAEGRVTQAEAAAARVAATEKPDDDPNGVAAQERKEAEAAITRHKGLIDTLRADKAKFIARTRGLEIHREIQSNTEIAQLLSPQGVFAGGIAERLVKFNAMLAEACEKIGIPAFEVLEDMNILTDRPALILSGSEKFRVRVVLQFVCARLDGSEMLIIDNDVDMDRKWYLPLLQMLKDLPALIMWRLDKFENHVDIEDAPEEMGINGRSYWIKDGNVLSYAEAVELSLANETHDAEQGEDGDSAGEDQPDEPDGEETEPAEDEGE